MSLQAGDRIGPYEILSVIGAGGMGEVYRARDTKLHREVAVKILPSALAGDPDRLARFEREAQTLASLNHPHIAQIYGLEALPAGAGGPGSALVMECVEGDDLAQRLSRGAIRVDEALPIARQIAEALEAAHERGIVHRDLKPANVKVAPDGTTKVLDFGLAKAFAAGDAEGPPRLGGNLANSPTFTSPAAMTQMGVILGTAPYMAPEQARGKPVDRRADIWAFGCVLYEMLSGRGPFGGEDVTDTLASIARDSPDWTRLPASVPPAVRTLIERCLDKDPRERLRDIGEARILLTRVPLLTTSAPTASRVRSGWAIRLAWAAAGLIAGAGAVLLWAPRGVGARPAVLSLQQLTEMPGAEIHPDISPDGRQVLYTAGAAGHRDLYLLRVGGGRAINLTASSPADDTQGAFSPDGERIAFRSERDSGGLFVMGATGESVKRVTSAGFDPRWSPDGTHLAYSTEGVVDPYSRVVRAELWTADVVSGATTRVWSGDAVQPSWSPHGTRIAFWANTAGQRDIWTIAAPGGTPVAVTADAATDWAPEWSPEGGALYFVSDRGGSPNLWRVTIDESSGVPNGVPEPVTNGTRALGTARFSRDGVRMVLGATDRSFELSLSDFDPASPDRGEARTTIHSPSLGWCAPSHDATWLACTSRTGHEDIVLLRGDGSETRRLTDDSVKDRIPVWSPNNRELAFMSSRTGQWELWAVGADGSGLRQLTDLRSDLAWGVWSPDGKRIAVASTSVTPYGLWFLDASRTSTRDAALFVPTDTRVGADSWSSDGALLAGTETTPAGDPAALTVWDVNAGRLLKRIEVPLVRAATIDVSFVPGTHDLLANTTDGVMLVNADTGRSRLVRKVAPPLQNRVSGDGRTLLVERPGLEADLWLMEFKK
jgi:Tol biopolymer transport system component